MPMKSGNAEIFVEHLQLMLNRKFLLLRFTRNHDESGAKRSTRVHFSLPDEFSQFPSVAILLQISNISLETQVRRANTRIIGGRSGWNLRVYPLGFLSGPLTVVVVVNSVLRYVAIVGTSCVCVCTLSLSVPLARTRIHVREDCREEHVVVRGRAGHARCGAPTRWKSR